MMKPARFPYASSKTRFSEVVVSERFHNLVKLFVEQECRVAQVLLKAFHIHRYMNPKSPYNYVTFREAKGLVSYMPTSKTQEYNEVCKWKRAGRQEVKPAKFLKDFVHPRLVKKFKDHELADFATKFKAFEESLQVDFKIVSVAEAYDEDNFIDRKTFGSCMMGEPVEAFYSNFDVSGVVAVRKSGAWVGRALLWNNIKVDGNSYSFLDRTYCLNVEVAELFQQWAKTNGHCRKEEQNAQNFNIVMPDETVTPTKNARVQTINGRSVDGCAFYPYLDTFAAGGNTTLYNCEDGEDYEYRETGGGRNCGGEEDNDYVYDVNNNRILQDDAVSMDGDWYHVDSESICHSYLHGYILRDDAIYVDGEYYLSSDIGTHIAYVNYEYYLVSSNSIVWSEDEEDYILADDAVEVDGDWYLETSNAIVYNEDLGAYMLRSDAEDVDTTVTTTKIVTEECYAADF